MLVNDKGTIKTYYDKIHMYDVVLSKKRNILSQKLLRLGKKIKLFKLPWGKIGLTYVMT